MVNFLKSFWKTENIPKFLKLTGMKTNWLANFLLKHTEGKIAKKGWFEFVFFFSCVANSSPNETLEFPPVCSPLPLWENCEKSICFLHNHITSHYLRNVKCKPQRPTISIFSLSFPSLISAVVMKKKGKCMQNIIIPQAIADFNKNLYKTGGCILFIVDYILDLGSHVHFLWLRYVLEVNEEWRLWQAEPNAFPLIGNTNLDNARPRLESLEERKKEDSRECDVLLWWYLVWFHKIVRA